MVGAVSTRAFAHRVALLGFLLLPFWSPSPAARPTAAYLLGITISKPIDGRPVTEILRAHAR